VFITNPLEQFKVDSLFNFYFFNGDFLYDFTLTNYSVTAFSLIFFLILSINIFSFNYKIMFFVQNLINTTVNLSLQMIKDHIGSIGKTLFPLLTSYLFLIFMSNVLGIVPYGLTLTAQLVITFYISLTLFLSLNLTGLMLHKENFLGFFFPSGTPLLLAPLIVPIEIISYVFRVISLSVRLFANMMAGHTLLKVIGGFSWSMFQSSGFIIICGIIPLLVVTILVGLELAVAFIQGYVFITLASMYFHDAFLLH
jgi:F-type H+-transporting ATPase subunit a